MFTKLLPLLIRNSIDYPSQQTSREDEVTEHGNKALLQLLYRSILIHYPYEIFEQIIKGK